MLASDPDSTCVWRVLSNNQAGKLLPGLKPPVREEISDHSLPSLSECFFLQITAPATTATMRRTWTRMMPMMGTED